MGTYLNPGNSGFTKIRNGEYVDKTGLIREMNRLIGTPYNMICVSRPRRFGKSYAAQMLSAYYDHSCDSKALFDDLQIAADPSYDTYRGQFHILYLDMSAIVAAMPGGPVTQVLRKELSAELAQTYPGLIDPDTAMYRMLEQIAAATNRKFIAIIDEWDAPIRDAEEDAARQNAYLQFLRSLFKNSGVTDQVFAAAYMTGILPIKKDGSQSALSSFIEYTMVRPGRLAPYIGFTEDEVRMLCNKYGQNFRTMKQWYDGYRFDRVGSIYNPNSVMLSIYNGEIDSYWTESSASRNLNHFIDLNYDGLAKAVAEIFSGIDVPVDVLGFSNDLVSFHSRDDVLTLLIHLGYLSYNRAAKTVHIPNEEIRIEFDRSFRGTKQPETLRRMADSLRLIDDTIHGRCEAVAAQIERVHREETAPLFYNNEQSLRSVLKLAYFAYRDYYVQVEELPAGTGYADVVYWPKQGMPVPMLLVELKWADSAAGAIQQIRSRNYPAALQQYGGSILLVGISYDRHAGADRRAHHVVIENWEHASPAPCAGV